MSYANTHKHYRAARKSTAAANRIYVIEENKRKWIPITALASFAALLLGIIIGLASGKGGE